ncbi:putative nucleophile aminohydrolase [Helianthus anomalus]
MRNLEGAYGIVFKIRRGYPLLLGVKEFKNNGTSYNNMEFISKSGHPKEFFLSSDSHALVEHTKKVLMIEENEVFDIKVIRISYHMFFGIRNGFVQLNMSLVGWFVSYFLLYIGKLLIVFSCIPTCFVGLYYILIIM